MAVIAYAGVPGSGKSYSVVEQVIIPAFRKGRIVVTNIELSKDALTEEFGEDGYDLRTFNAENAAEYIKDLPAGFVLVIDEVWLLWPAGTTVTDFDEDHKKLLSMHRHMVDEQGRSPEIILVSQSFKDVATFVRSRIDRTFIVIKQDDVGLSKRFRVHVYRGCVEASLPPKQKKTIRVAYGKYKPEVTKFYQSHTMSEASDDIAVLEERMDKRGTIFTKFLFFKMGAALLVVIGGLYYAVHFFGSLGSGADMPLLASEAKAIEPKPGRRPTSAAKTEVALPEAAPPFSDHWRLVGVVGTRGSELAIVEHQESGARVRFLLRKSCDREPGGAGWVCDWAGERVAAWTGLTNSRGNGDLFSRGLQQAQGHVRRVAE